MSFYRIIQFGQRIGPKTLEAFHYTTPAPAIKAKSFFYTKPESASSWFPSVGYKTI